MDLDKSASLQRLVGQYKRVSRYLSGETSQNGTSGPNYFRVRHNRASEDQVGV
jgi:hypothetical protein